MHMHNCIMHNEHTAHPALSTESTQEVPSPLQLLLDTPGDDFYILDSSMTVEEMLARLQMTLGAGLFHVTPSWDTGGTGDTQGHTP